MSLPPIDKQYYIDTLLHLLRIPSPTGFTQDAVAFVQEELTSLGVTSTITPKGALLWTLDGETEQSRTIASHIDTLGLIVKEIKENGRLKLSMLGSFDWACVEGVEVVIHTFEGAKLTGTVVNTVQSSHVFGAKLRDLKRTAEVMEVRLDAETSSQMHTQGLGVEVGNIISIQSIALETETGFIKGRHLDNKAAVAASLAITKSLVGTGIKGDMTTHFFVSNYEEVGHGASTGIPEDTRELLCVDMAAIGEGQNSDEYSVTLCVKDSSGPYDYGMNQRLRELAHVNGIRLKTDIYPYYGSDASAAWRSGGNYPAALIGPGVDASHAYERTHWKALDATAKLMMAYVVQGKNKRRK